jgi:hypothetical protein
MWEIAESDAARSSHMRPLTTDLKLWFKTLGNDCQTKRSEISIES